MKNKVIVTACTLLAMATASAQNAYDAEKLLGNDLNGTARFVGMGGAMGALGGDISVMSSNPAGIGIFRSNDVSVSFGFNNTSTKSNFSGVSMNEDKTRASFDQIGFVYSNKIGNNTSLRFVNFGFNYHKSKNFNRLFSMGGALDNMSQSFQLAQEMERYGLTESEFNDILDAKNPYTKYWNQLPVLGVMGVRTGVVDWFNDPEKNIHAPWGWNGFNNNFFSKETGGISQYDFNVSFNIEDRVYLGATLGVYDVNYDRYTSYTENLNDDKGADNGGYTLDNYYRLEGTGMDLKLGVIVRPIESSPFRLGFAVHTPTWYDLRESYNATLSSDILAYEKPYIQTLSDFLVTPEYDYLTYDYNLTTPWKFNVSAGTTFAGAVAVGAEYEYQDYSSSKLKDVDGYAGGMYDVHVKNSWYVQPQLLFTYEEFRSKTRLGTDSFFSKFNLELPILASYNVALNNKWNLRINAGPYLSYAMFGRDKSIDYAYGNGMHSSLGWWHQDFPDHFTYGGRAGVSLESEHFIYTIDGKCSLRKRPFGQSVSLSAGVGYKF